MCNSSLLCTPGTRLLLFLAYFNNHDNHWYVLSCMNASSLSCPLTFFKILCQGQYISMNVHWIPASLRG